MPEAPEKLDLRSLDMSEEKRQELLRLFPEIRTEVGKIDFDRLKLVLGETVDVGKERYGMHWPGKADCFKTIQTPSIGTLRPCPEESVNWDTTENLIIEGDNLEALKLLQKSYLGRIKMIYIDPPYNTGNDFIYPDNFSESLQTYLEYTGQVDAQGRKFGTNTDTDGRFHSKWMNMMYPRLYLARNVLRDDGVIFISINDVELSNIINLCNEIFGEKNHLATFIWLNEGNIDNQSKIKVNHEYIVMYAKNEELFKAPPVIDPNIGEDSKLFNEFIENTVVKNGKANPISEIELPIGFPSSIENGIIEPQFEKDGITPKQDFWPKLKNSVNIKNFKTENTVIVSSGWSSKDLLLEYISNSCKPIVDAKNQETTFYISATGAVYYKKKRLDSQSHVLTVLKGMGTVQESSSYLETLNISFSYPKPLGLMEYLIKIGSGDEDIVMDFFAGSGSFGEAVYRLNKTGANRKFVLIQLPEKIDNNIKTISEITKTRMSAVISKYREEVLNSPPLLLDNQFKDKIFGYKLFKLFDSNFKPWDSTVSHDSGALEQQLELYVDHIKEGRTDHDLLFEILIKRGFPLTTQVETLTLAGHEIYGVAGTMMLVCLQRDLSLELVRAMADLNPECVVCLDEGFAGNDQLKTNAVQIFKTKGVAKFLTV